MGKAATAKTTPTTHSCPLPRSKHESEGCFLHSSPHRYTPHMVMRKTGTGCRFWLQGKEQRWQWKMVDRFVGLSTVPFRSIRPVTCHRVCGLALILVNVTRHIDFGRMREMIQKNSFKNIFLSWFKNLFTSTLDTTIISKMSNTHWHPGKRCCIPLHKKIYQNSGWKFCLSQVTTQVARMLKCDCCVTCHTPGWIDRNGTVDPYPYPWGIMYPPFTTCVELEQAPQNWVCNACQSLQGGKHLHCWSGDIIITLYRSVPESHGWLVASSCLVRAIAMRGIYKSLCLFWWRYC